MVDYSNVTKASLLKKPIGTAVYTINGRRVTFKIVYFDGGIPYGYCKSRGWWAHLCAGYIDVESVGIVSATQISLDTE